MREATSTGRWRKDAKLTDEAVRDIRQTYRSFKWGDGKKLAYRWGVSQTLISSVVAGRCWNHVTD